MSSPVKSFECVSQHRELVRFVDPEKCLVAVYSFRALVAVVAKRNGEPVVGSLSASLAFAYVMR